MILGIDASNLRVGGGVTHLTELLGAARLPLHGFSQVIVWSGSRTLKRIEEQPWLRKAHEPVLDEGLLRRAMWQRTRLSAAARAAACDVLLVPGGTYAGDFHPVVTMSRNLLPFEWRELRRYGWSRMALKTFLLRLTQTRSFRRADGLIFLTDYAREAVTRVTGDIRGRAATVPHGIDTRFVLVPRPQRPIESFSASQPFRILYVSIIDMYKHQWHVAEAVASLRAGGLPITLELVGPAYPPAMKRLRATLARVDPRGEFIHCPGAVSHDALPARYAQADLCVFASSCENMPNILLEAMASGLPIACSRLGPMPELLGDGGVYFDPERPQDIAHALRNLIESPALRAQLAQRSFARAGAYSWQRCADETFAFLATCARSAERPA